jgi:hypothetical protein
MLYNTSQWNDAVSVISDGGDDKNYVNNVMDSFSVAGNTDSTFSANGVTVSIRSSGKILTLSGSGNILRVNNNQEVIIRDISLRGISSNNNSLVYVDGGTFTKNSRKITGNTGSGNGVFVDTGGYLNIVTGTIYGSNEAEANTSLRNTTSSSGDTAETTVSGLNGVRQ